MTQQESRALDYGDDAVQRPIDSILDDRASATPLQAGPKKDVDKCKAKATGKTLVIIAGGWNYPGGSAEEIAAIANDSWEPTTADFRAMAGASAPVLARTAQEFIQQIASQPTGSIGRVVYIGHGGGGLAFSGTPGLGGGSGLNAEDLPDLQAEIDSKVKPKLHRYAKVDLYTCYAGGNEQFTDALANALNRCVRGFGSAIEVRNPVVTEQKQITQRGYARVEGAKAYKKGWKHLKPFEWAIRPAN